MAEGIPPGDHQAHAASRIFETSALGPAEIRRARQQAVSHLAERGHGNTDDVALVLSELVTNAVVHAGGAVRIAVSVGDRIRVEVHDEDPRPPRMRAHGAEPGGLGLRIVERLSERWGSRSTAAGKVVWADLPTRE